MATGPSYMPNLQSRCQPSFLIKLKQPFVYTNHLFDCFMHPRRLDILEPSQDALPQSRIKDGKPRDRKSIRYIEKTLSDPLNEMRKTALIQLRVP